MERDMEASIAASSVFPGFRFCPTDEELISYYLKNKLDGCDKSVQVIPEVDLCRYEPWDLPVSSLKQILCNLLDFRLSLGRLLDYLPNRRLASGFSPFQA
ncbi:hypothetical protein RJ639_023920 [Escallonia herrerae]|uniref:NAC domain-containing protein n=1 Tax=Escallonia herrerae TaxID=1293975 RepID=A0AA88UYI8_9ASTE|nr:hypothetical protein RJ639_023920 [Escallonia herrerae]